MFFLQYELGLEVERITFSLSRVTVSTVISGNKARKHHDNTGVAWCVNELPNSHNPNKHTTVSRVQYIHLHTSLHAYIVQLFPSSSFL